MFSLLKRKDKRQNLIQIEAIGKRTTEYNEINKIEELIRLEFVTSETEKKQQEGHIKSKMCL